MEKQPEKLDLVVSDFTKEKRAVLKELFPNVFTEARSADGKVVESVDFEKLKAELGTFSELFESRRERYSLDWPGKRDAQHVVQQPSFATLHPKKGESLQFDVTPNLFIEGDNLESLKVLQKSLYGQVKAIYIDPPYNTGNDFIYPDDFSESLDTYLKFSGQLDAEGKRFNTNPETDGRYHSKWMSMMYPRLYLARNLLKDQGVILVSIDDHEIHNLRLLMNEIFGDENFISTFVWKRRQVSDNRNINQVSTDHEYVVAYTKGNVVFAGSEKDLTKYTNPDNDPRGPWMSDNLTGLASKEERPNLHYDVVDPKTKRKFPPHPARGWAYEPKTMAKAIAEGRILFPKDPEGRPRLKRFLADIKSQTTGFSTIPEDVGYTTNGTRELDELFGKKVFPFPKPVGLLKALLKQITQPQGEDIVLDFFAGSGTTAHAVLELNAEDGGNRRFVCIQLPEPAQDNAEARSLGLNTIAEISKERIRRSISKLHEKHPLLKDASIGFRAFSLGASNFSLWDAKASQGEEAVGKQLEMHIVNVVDGSNQESLLFEILLKSGFKPSEAIEEKSVAGKRVFSISGGALLICLEPKVSKALIDEVVKLEPFQFICLDSAFEGNDQLKANTVQAFGSNRKDRDKSGQITFRTV